MQTGILFIANCIPGKHNNMYTPPETVFLISCSSALYNGTLFEYDPYTHESKMITIPGITGNPAYHVGGIDMDVYSGSVYIGANAGTPFITDGRNLSGPNRLIRYDTFTQGLLWEVDLSGFQEEVLAQTGQFVTGFQDQAEDPRGNAYMLASFGNAIARIDSRGQEVSVFYAPGLHNSSILGIQGLFTIEDTLVVSDDRSLGFLVFDTREKRGVPTKVKPQGEPKGYVFSCDGLLAPSKYGGTVALCSNDFVNGTGGIAVYQSWDGWESAQWKGFILNNDPAALGSTPTATVEIAASIFISEELFASGDVNPQTRLKFPFIDITSQVENLLSH
jgi:hypothetical protein